MFSRVFGRCASRLDKVHRTGPSLARGIYQQPDNNGVDRAFQTSQGISVGDFRSDTVTLPTSLMLEAMFSSPLGDDVYGEDHTVNKLETTIASMCGKESALFCPTGTMTNQIGMRLHLLPLQNAICDSRSHIYNYESGGVAYHSQAQLIPVTPRNGHHLTLNDIQENLHESDDLHTPHTTLIALENTLNGLVNPMQNIRAISAYAKERNIKMHMDGARLWNACIKTGHQLSDYCQHFDTVSLCFSKGLGAPIGSCLVGSQKDIKRARHFRKLFGGGWRQAGGLAGAALYALSSNWLNMYQDHEITQQLYTELTSMGYKCDMPETNMLWIDTSDKERPWDKIVQTLKEQNVRIGSPYQGKMRLVCHFQIEPVHVETLLRVLRESY